MKIRTKNRLEDWGQSPDSYHLFSNWFGGCTFHVDDPPGGGMEVLSLVVNVQGLSHGGPLIFFQYCGLECPALGEGVAVWTA